MLDLVLLLLAISLKILNQQLSSLDLLCCFILQYYYLFPCICLDIKNLFLSLGKFMVRVISLHIYARMKIFFGSNCIKDLIAEQLSLK